MLRLRTSNLSSSIFSVFRCFGSSLTLKSPLDSIHRKYDAKMGEFCGWDMPFSYPSLTPTESHFHTREKSSLFDVSHMLRLRLEGKNIEEFIEKLFVVDLNRLSIGQGAYTLLMNESGGIKDDAIIAKCDGYYYLVLNAACADKDFSFLHSYAQEFKNLNRDVIINKHSGALIAVQGPEAENVLKKYSKDSSKISALNFMDTNDSIDISGTNCRITRCGYTGEDGFEVEIKENITDIVELLLSHESLELAGLIARDTLRLESGLALYGNDLNENTTPIESSLNWTISKRRRENKDFLGADIVLNQLTEGTKEKRVGLVAPPGRLLRPGMQLLKDSKIIGNICSGGFSPCLKHPIGMAYVSKGFSKIGTELVAESGKKTIPVTVF